jgi:hypothetical protein
MDAHDAAYVEGELGGVTIGGLKKWEIWST